LDDLEHLVGAEGGGDEVPALDQLLDGLGVLAQTEEVVFLRHLGQLEGRVIGTAAIDEIALLLPLLAALAVETLVERLVDVILRAKPAEDLLAGAMMGGGRGPDEEVVREVQLLPGA